MDKKFNNLFVILAIISFIHISRGQQGFDFNELLDNQEASSPTPSQPPAEGLAPTTTTASPAYLACFNGCQTITNYNPVCGSDGVTYTNEYRLKCARQCGHQVTMNRGGTCVGL